MKLPRIHPFRARRNRPDALADDRRESGEEAIESAEAYAAAAADAKTPRLKTAGL